MLIPDRSLGTKNTPGLKKGKQRLSLYFTVSQAGRKLKVWAIHKSFKPRAFGAANIHDIERAMDIKWYANKKAWMTGQIFIAYLLWFDSQMSEPTLLLMDNFSGHTAAIAELEGRQPYPLKWTTCRFLPPNTTSKVQPLDQGIIASFKAQYRRLWLEYMIDEAESNRDPIQSMNVLKSLRWIVRAWHAVTPETIANCWLHSALSPPRFGPPTLREFRRQGGVHNKGNTNTKPAEQQEAERQLAIQLRKLERDKVIKQAMDIASFVERDDEVIEDSEDDIITSIVEAYEPAVEEEEPTMDEAIPRVTMDQAIQALKTL